MRSFANLLIFRTSGDFDPGEVTLRLGITPDAAGVPGQRPYWRISTEGHVASDSIRPHVEFLLRRIAGQE